MYRIQLLVSILAWLPFVMALIFSFAVVPQRKKNLRTSMDPTSRPSGHRTESDAATIEGFVRRGIDRAVDDYESLRSYRLLVPAFILSLLYWLGFSLGLSLLVDRAAESLPFSWPFFGFNKTWLYNPAVALVGAYVFNMGLLVRRAFMADFTKNVMWAAINRIVLSVGYAIIIHFLHPAQGKMYQKSGIVISFALAFFPRILLTVLRRSVTNWFSVDDNASKELNIQLISGIDVWKEERLEEEGIESVQNMATADIFGLIPKLHYPVRTIIDWMDQAIFIQRFAMCLNVKDESPLSRLRDIEAAGFPTSALEYIDIGSADNVGDAEFVTKMATAAQVDRAVLQQALRTMSHDPAVRVLARLWQTGSLTD